ncbi:MAG TPA: hypothetical protein VHK91_11690 [Flavisolibacter sp.]|jgi:hypothetical protein|nr:hypothetical protein [Flavisolibacter sp.]
MKPFLVFVLIAVTLVHCQKKKEEIQKNLVIEAMTNGQWKVTSFKKESVDRTTDFTPYAFQFHENFTVDALNGGLLEKTGMWSADASAQTITATFTNSTNPLPLLNGTWKITRNSWTYVEATLISSAGVSTLRLDKF